MPRRKRTPYEQAVMDFAGQQLRAAREAKGWSTREFEAELARRGKVALGYSMIAAIERGVYAVPFATLVCMAEALEIPADLLLPPREESERDRIARGFYAVSPRILRMARELLAVDKEYRRSLRRGKGQSDESEDA